MTNELIVMQSSRISLKGRTQNRQLLTAFNHRKGAALLASIMPAATHRKAIPASRQRLTLRVQHGE